MLECEEEGRRGTAHLVTAARSMSPASSAELQREGGALLRLNVEEGGRWPGTTGSSAVGGGWRRRGPRWPDPALVAIRGRGATARVVEGAGVALLGRGARRRSVSWLPAGCGGRCGWWRLGRREGGWGAGDARGRPGRKRTGGGGSGAAADSGLCGPDLGSKRFLTLKRTAGLIPKTTRSFLQNRRRRTTRSTSWFISR